MMKAGRIILLMMMLAGASLLSAGEFFLTIQGTTPRNRINLGKRENLNLHKDSFRQKTTLSFRASRDFTEGKVTLKVKKADEFSFSVAGEFFHNTETSRQYFHWIEIERLKVNNDVLIGKGSKANPEPLNVSQLKPLGAKVKVRGNSELVIEVKFRETPADTAKELSEKEGISDSQKSLRDKRERQAKKRQERKAKKSGGKSAADQKSSSKTAAAADEESDGEE